MDYSKMIDTVIFAIAIGFTPVEMRNLLLYIGTDVGETPIDKVSIYGITAKYNYELQRWETEHERV